MGKYTDDLRDENGSLYRCLALSRLFYPMPCGDRTMVDRPTGMLKIFFGFVTGAEIVALMS